jgi:23S rRNA (cytosine1962-C5)-methyltransferase
VRELWPDFSERLVVYEDAALLVVDKPAGVPSQAAHEAHDDDLVARLRRWLAKREGVEPEEIYLGVHQRLDRDTSGLVLFTRSRDKNPAIAEQFRSRQIGKTYLAAVALPAGQSPLRDRLLVHHLGKARDGRMQVVSGPIRGAREARTRVATREQAGDRALLELGCDTGRTHQLRVQLAHEGAAIAGDQLYGTTPALRLMLHAAALRCAHPDDGRELRFAAQAPPEIDDWLRHGARDVVADETLLQRALQLAVERRYRLGRARLSAQPTSAFRLFHAAAEGSGAFALDLYGEHALLHLFEEPDQAREQRLLDAVEAMGFDGIYLKRHSKQKNELANPRDPRYAPSMPARGRAAPEEFLVQESGLPFGVRLGDGLRTGLFLDQRDNRQRVRDLAKGKRVLNLFAYTGGFSLAALDGGASEALCIDASATALSWGQRNVARIGAQERHRSWHGDVLDALGRLGRRGERFDLIILDPPSYSRTRSRRFVATKDYAALCQACLRVLAPAGHLLACINHHGTSQAKLRRDVHEGARACGVALVQVKDMPVSLDFPAPYGGEPSSKSVLVACE